MGWPNPNLACRLERRHGTEPYRQENPAATQPGAGGAFLAAASWLDGHAAQNRPLAIGLTVVLMGAGLLTQLLP